MCARAPVPRFLRLMVTLPMKNSIRTAFAPQALLISTALLFFAAPAVCVSQASQQPVLTVKTQSSEVILPVTVRDKKGQIVSSLKADDFTLTEDGRAETIKSFSNPVNQPLRLGLLIDTSRSQGSALAGERTASGKFVDLMLTQPADKAFLLHFDHEVELLQDFTSSKDKLHRELDEMTTATGGGENAQVEGGSGEGQGEGGEHRSRGHRGGTQMYDAIYLASNEVMASQPGRKAVILFSDGVDRGSKESLSSAVDAAEKANVSVYTVYFKGEEERQPMQQGMGGRHGGMGGGGMGGGWPGGGGGMGRHGGGGPYPQSGEVKVDGKKIMEQIASRTGGRFFEAKKKDGFDEVYAQIMEELHGQYLLTYTPDKAASSDDSTDGFHKISLKAKNADYTVYTREGYFDSGR